MMLYLKREVRDWKKDCTGPWLRAGAAPTWWRPSGKEKQTGGASLEQPAMKHVKSRSLFFFFLDRLKARETSKCWVCKYVHKHTDVSMLKCYYLTLKKRGHDWNGRGPETQQVREQCIKNNKDKLWTWICSFMIGWLAFYRQGLVK